MPRPAELILPDTLDPVHAALLRDHHFVTAGTLGFVIRGDAYDGIRVLYAILNPAQTAVVYVGDSEVGRDLRGRLKDHLSRRSKAGHVERDSLVCVHVMVTEYMVLDGFERETGGLPVLNKRKTPKHIQNRAWKVNDAAAEAADRRRDKITLLTSGDGRRPRR